MTAGLSSSFKYWSLSGVIISARSFCISSIQYSLPLISIVPLSQRTALCMSDCIVLFSAASSSLSGIIFSWFWLSVSFDVVLFVFSHSFSHGFFSGNISIVFDCSTKSADTHHSCSHAFTLRKSLHCSFFVSHKNCISFQNPSHAIGYLLLSLRFRVEFLFFIFTFSLSHELRIVSIFPPSFIESPIVQFISLAVEKLYGPQSSPNLSFLQFSFISHFHFLHLSFAAILSGALLNLSYIF
jgi:hypothetical protein